MITTLNTEELRKFLMDANAAGYAAADTKKWIHELDGSTSIPFEKGLWRLRDNFFGGEPYGGRMIVFYQGKPAWIMVYYGKVEESANPDEIYTVLRSALKNMPKDAPFRGPRTFKSGNYHYTNSWTGNLTEYAGKEEIRKMQKSLYSANYRGGLVDVRKGD